MKSVLQSPWFTVVLTIVVMTIGYTLYLNRLGGNLASASGFCPAKAICKTEECKTHGCGLEKCKHCPSCDSSAS